MPRSVLGRAEEKKLMARKGTARWGPRRTREGSFKACLGDVCFEDVNWTEVWIVLSSGMWRRVVWLKGIYVSEEYAAFIFNVGYSFTLEDGGITFLENSCTAYKTTWCQGLEDSSPHSHSREKRKSVVRQRSAVARERRSCSRQLLASMEEKSGRQATVDQMCGACMPLPSAQGARLISFCCTVRPKHAQAGHKITVEFENHSLICITC
jgi:hypothetical protein